MAPKTAVEAAAVKRLEVRPLEGKCLKVKPLAME